MRTSSETRRAAKAAILRQQKSNGRAANAGPTVHLSQSTQLVNIALQKSTCALYHTAEGLPFAQIEIGGHVETWRLRSGGFREWLVREYFGISRKPPGGQAIQDAIATLEAIARYDANERVLNLRVAQSEGKLYLDLCDADWRVVEISQTGWRVSVRSPVAFRRAKGMLALPCPSSGHLTHLKPLLNIEEPDWVLCAAWLVGAMHPSGPYPILAIHGEQGSAKTLCTKMLRQILDPSALMVRSMFRDERDLQIAASNGRILAWDNISRLADWQSDALCRLATGSGFGTRKLHSDDEESCLKRRDL